VFRLQFVEPVPADSGDDVVAGLRQGPRHGPRDR
jgi:hypothetical protein